MSYKIFKTQPLTAGNNNYIWIKSQPHSTKLLFTKLLTYNNLRSGAKGFNDRWAHFESKEYPNWKPTLNFLNNNN